MSTPYDKLPNQAFWRRSVSSVPSFLLDPVRNSSFKISKSDAVATAGSCFAQHLSRAIQARGFNYLISEDDLSLSTHDRHNRNFGVYSARFGNIYNVKQLRQLIERAYGLADYAMPLWQRPDKRWVDPFRPNIEPDGYADEEALLADRKAHLHSVRKMFAELDVLVFTLGLTEGWEHIGSGASLPLAPGVVASDWDPGSYMFANYTTEQILTDLRQFFDILKSVNASARMLLTVSPVPLIATYSPSSVLAATVYSKSVLRVVAEEFSNRNKGVDYFPSFEIINNPVVGNRYFEPDFRSIRPEGVAHVMRIFFKHYVNDGPLEVEIEESRQLLQENSKAQSTNLFKVVCDEESIENNVL
ncbi:GSCFA domain-containing protein [Allorhizobium terrae]|uniref:GSCFA family protein n=1 Tax=Allorhizobium terrae TaxID=1848972 RepID=A0A4S3ZR76_9HYPH|nr:GSCFA domain-containing protein [Allorhizobium terrae]THF48085.1 GSCFA family protein [Allorhizobium terrae]